MATKSRKFEQAEWFKIFSAKKMRIIAFVLACVIAGGFCLSLVLYANSHADSSSKSYLKSESYKLASNEMYEELCGIIRSVNNPYYKKLLSSFFLEDKEFEKRFKFHSAAKTVHHGFVGGLLEHTLSVTKHCDYFAAYYPMLNRDRIVTAAIFHDIGKLEELSVFPENDYTDEGQLLGHIMIGAEMVGERIRTIEGFPVRMANELKHCILAHHGELEYGSPKKPALAEALALSFADNVDAKMETIREIFTNVPENSVEWQGFNRLLDSNIRRSSLK